MDEGLVKVLVAEVKLAEEELFELLDEGLGWDEGVVLGEVQDGVLDVVEDMVLDEAQDGDLDKVLAYLLVADRSYV